MEQNSVSVDTLVERVSCLERRISAYTRRTTCLAIGSLVVISVVFTLTRAGNVPTSGVAIGDRNGRPIIELMEYPDNSHGLTIRNKHDASHASLLEQDGELNLAFFDPDRQCRLAVGSCPIKKTPRVTLFAKREIARCDLGLNQNGSPFLALYDHNARVRGGLSLDNNERFQFVGYSELGKRKSSFSFTQSGMPRFDTYAPDGEPTQSFVLTESPTGELVFKRMESTTIPEARKK